jgi:hypothetical protein
MVESSSVAKRWSDSEPVKRGGLVSAGCNEAASDVVILSSAGEEDPEVLLLRGALRYCHTSTSISTEPLAGTRPLFFVDASSGQPCRDLVVRVGRRVTQQHCQAPQPVSPDEIVVLGEPYSTVQEFALRRESLQAARGKALVGPLFDVRQYSSPPSGHSPAALMTSLGCEKRCGYCSYGAACRSLYGSGFTRRPRPAQDLCRELAAATAAGIGSFQILADQFLSANTQHNGELRELACSPSVRNLGKPALCFTVSPREVVNNQELLLALSDAFILCPRLSIESLDDQTLSLLDLDFDSAIALQAFEFLTTRAIRLRLNYLFVRPGMTMEVVRREFRWFRTFADCASDLTPLDRLLLAHDLFSRSLQLLPGAPVTAIKGISHDYEAKLPSVVFRILIKVQNTLEEHCRVLAGEQQPAFACDPLVSVLDVAAEELNR